MKNKIETALINSTEIAVDVSLIQNTDQMFFNATDMAKPFKKMPAQWLRLPDTEAYIEALLNVGLSHIIYYDDLVQTRRGRTIGGTWLHQDLGLAFARWLSHLFAVRMDMWVKDRLKCETEHRNTRLESKTGYLPLTKAISEAHDDLKPHHFSNENNLLYRIVFGMTAKEYRQNFGVSNVIDHLPLEQLVQLNELQAIDTVLIKLKKTYQERKETLTTYFEGYTTPLQLQ